ncbi:hypothetical protein [Ilumatobacter sp.]|uniref:hypothetical protein n=1 Tax=Ilumatobacter sp. TaxID=1967498 RepID=UPI003C45DE25
MGSSDDTTTEDAFSLRVEGRVGASGALALDTLRGLATGIDAGRPSIALVDVFAPIRLSASADVLVVSSPDPRSVALPVRAVMRRPNIRLIVDGSSARPAVLLDAPDWTDDDPPFVVERLTALTFYEFVLRP